MSLSSLLKKLENFVHGAEVKVSEAFVAVFGKQAAEQFAQGALGLLKTAEGQIVLKVVQAVETLGIDGAGKRASAFQQIVAEFKTQGLAVGESLINMLIEIAVAYLRGTVAPL
jgi:hypothetical protein